MTVLDLKGLIQAIKKTPRNTTSLAWVYRLLLQQKDIRVSPEDTIMLSGEGFAFTYSPYQHEFQTYSSANFSHRLYLLYGFNVECVKGTRHGGNINEIWNFIIATLNQESGLHVWGNRSFIITGYKDAAVIDERKVEIFSFETNLYQGEISWQEFVTIVSETRMICRLVQADNFPTSNEMMLGMVNTILDYQELHPTNNWEFLIDPSVSLETNSPVDIITSKNYGITAIQYLIEDVEHPTRVKEILQTYLHGNAMGQQITTRRWQAEWFNQRTRMVSSEIEKICIKISRGYEAVAMHLEDFLNTNRENLKAGILYEDINNCIPSLKVAKEKEEEVIDLMKALADALEK